MRWLAMLAFFGATAAFAQNSPSPEEIMSQNDRNGDGQITKEEAEAAGTQLARLFDQVDTNKDRRITLDELRAMQSRR
jgi:Ca2+-binding EF-hand superfamily protein